MEKIEFEFRKIALERVLENVSIDTLELILSVLKEEEHRIMVKQIIDERKKKMEDNIKTRITKFDVDWVAIKNKCRTTVNKDESSVEPSDEWKKKLLISQHSPIRRSDIEWEWVSIPYAISTHYVRHHVGGVEKWISTERSDRTGINREELSQMNPVKMEMMANIQSVINIAEKRLCLCADPTTRKYMESLKEAIGEYDKNVAWALVPSCVRCGGCIEGFGNCNFYEMLMKGIPADEQMDLMKRYDIYDEYYQGRTRVRKK